MAQNVMKLQASARAAEQQRLAKLRNALDSFLGDYRFDNQINQPALEVVAASIDSVYFSESFATPEERDAIFEVLLDVQQRVIDLRYDLGHLQSARACFFAGLALQRIVHGVVVRVTGHKEPVPGLEALWQGTASPTTVVNNAVKLLEMVATRLHISSPPTVGGKKAQRVLESTLDGVLGWLWLLLASIIAYTALVRTNTEGDSAARCALSYFVKKAPSDISKVRNIARCFPWYALASARVLMLLLNSKYFLRFENNVDAAVSVATGLLETPLGGSVTPSPSPPGVEEYSVENTVVTWVFKALRGDGQLMREYGFMDQARSAGVLRFHTKLHEASRKVIAEQSPLSIRYVAAYYASIDPTRSSAARAKNPRRDAGTVDMIRRAHETHSFVLSPTRPFTNGDKTVVFIFQCVFKRCLQSRDASYTAEPPNKWNPAADRQLILNVFGLSGKGSRDAVKTLVAAAQKAFFDEVLPNVPHTAPLISDMVLLLTVLCVDDLKPLIEKLLMFSRRVIGFLDGSADGTDPAIVLSSGMSQRDALFRLGCHLWVAFVAAVRSLSASSVSIFDTKTAVLTLRCLCELYPCFFTVYLQRRPRNEAEGRVLMKELSNFHLVLDAMGGVLCTSPAVVNTDIVGMYVTVMDEDRGSNRNLDYARKAFVSHMMSRQPLVKVLRESVLGDDVIPRALNGLTSSSAPAQLKSACHQTVVAPILAQHCLAVELSPAYANAVTTESAAMSTIIPRLCALQAHALVRKLETMTPQAVSPKTRSFAPPVPMAPSSSTTPTGAVPTHKDVMAGSGAALYLVTRIHNRICHFPQRSALAMSKLEETVRNLYLTGLVSLLQCNHAAVLKGVCNSLEHIVLTVLRRKGDRYQWLDKMVKTVEAGDNSTTKKDVAEWVLRLRDRVDSSYDAGTSPRGAVIVAADGSIMMRSRL